MSDETPNEQRSPFSEDTVVHPADAKTVIRPSGQTVTNESVKPLPATHFEAMPEVNHSMKDEKTEGAIPLPPSRSHSRSRSRSRSKGPDLKMIVGGAVTLVLVVSIIHQFTKTPAPKAPVTEGEQAELASVAAPPPVVQKFKSPETTKSMDVLAKFEQAAARAQSRAFEPAK